MSSTTAAYRGSGTVCFRQLGIGLPQFYRSVRTLLRRDLWDGMACPIPNSKQAAAENCSSAGS